MAKFRGITWNNSRFGPKIQIRRSIDIAELSDFGNITDEPNDLPTRGALHRTWTDSAETPIHGSKSGTRSYTDLRYVDSNVVDTQDMGLISETATTHRIWSSTGAISDVVTTAPTTLGNPGSGSSTNSAVAADYALDFTGTNNYLSVAESDTSGWFTNSSGWSVELWFKHNTVSSYHTNDGLVNQYGNIVLFAGGGYQPVYWAGYKDSTTSYTLSSADITDTAWHHLHIGYDGTTVRMFLDGALQDSETTSLYDGNTDSDFFIGARAGGVTNTPDSFWDGYMADIHITSGSTDSVRTSAFDVDDITAPTETDDTVLLVYGTSSGIVNETSLTLTENGSGSAIGYDAVQPY